jgi:hypothetical protein
MGRDHDDGLVGKDDSDPSPKPDWIIDLSVPRETFDSECQNLLDRIEKTLKTTGPRGTEYMLAAVGPMVCELHARGLSVQTIADHSRIRPRVFCCCSRERSHVRIRMRSLSRKPFRVRAPLEAIIIGRSVSRIAMKCRPVTVRLAGDVLGVSGAQAKAARLCSACTRWAGY